MVNGIIYHAIIKSNRINSNFLVLSDNKFIFMIPKLFQRCRVCGQIESRPKKGPYAFSCYFLIYFINLKCPFHFFTFVIIFCTLFFYA